MKHKISYYFSTIFDGNLAFHTQDDEKKVIQNRKKLAEKLNYDYEKLIYMNQTHGSNVKVVDYNSLNLIEDCDALITNCKNLPLMVMVADCIPILLFDEILGVVCAIHAGRNSTFLEISKKALQKMVDEFGCKVENIKAIFGPSIQKCCYEVDDSLAKIVRNSFGEEFVLNNHINLQEINKKQLTNLGLKDITISTICTKCSNEPYFSYRKDKKCGRFAAVILLED